jgi:NAD(P)H-flavin reductase
MANPVKLRAEVSSVETHGTGVYKVELKPLGRIPRYKPGQFLHLTVDEYDPAGGFWPESRVFSISSGYGDEKLVIVYSVQGQYTKRMEETLAVGKTVWVKLPYGEFVIDSNSGGGQDIVLIAGGTGVSPYIPFLEGFTRGDLTGGRNIAMYYGAREKSSILFRDILGKCTCKENFALSLVIENEAPDGLNVSGAKLERGRLDIVKIRNETKGLKRPVYFLSGPPIMIKLFKKGLIDSGVDEDNIKIDEWE